jgi:hypothetical protein
LKKLLTSIVFLFTFVTVFSSPEYTVVDEHFFPNPAYVGDTVEYTLSISLRDSGVPEVPQFESCSAQKIKFVDVRILPEDKQNRRYTVKISYIPFFVGSYTLPDINLGAVVLKGLRVRTESVLNEGMNIPAPARGQLMLPGTRTFIILFILAVLVIPVLLLAFSGKIRQLKAVLSGMMKNRRPVKKFIKDVSVLRDSYMHINANDFYTVLLDYLRFFLGYLFQEDFRTTTTGEISLLLDSLDADLASKNYLKKIFANADLIKFGGMDVSPEQKKHDAEEVLSVCLELEKMRREKLKEEAGKDDTVSEAVNGI